MRILILGSTGLLGNTFTKYFFDKENFQTFAAVRNYSKIKFFNKKYHERFVHIENILDYTRGNQIKASSILGLNRNTLRKKISELGVTVRKVRKSSL